MKATSHHRPTLERRQSNAPPMDPRISERRLRVALHAVIARDGTQLTPAPAHPWHDLTRDEPRAALPCTREREMIHAAIRQGCTTPNQVLSYHLARIADDMAQFDDAPTVSDVCYVRLMAEQAEALEAQALARAFGTPEAEARAAIESEDAITALRLYVAHTQARR